MGLALSVSPTAARADAPPAIRLIQEDINADGAVDSAIVISTFVGVTERRFTRVHSGADGRLLFAHSETITHTPDLNGDGVLDSQDINIILSAIGTDNLNADLDGDGAVTVEDVVRLLDLMARRNTDHAERVTYPIPPCDSGLTCQIPPGGCPPCGNEPGAGGGGDNDGIDSLLGTPGGDSTGGTGGNNQPGPPPPPDDTASDNNDDDSDGCENPFEIITQTVAEAPANRARKIVGVHERVILTTSPQTDAAWSVEPGEVAEVRTVTTPTGEISVLIISGTTGDFVLRATAGECVASVGLSVLAPTFVAYGSDFADAGGYPLEPGNELIGNGRVFMGFVGPTSVSFEFAPIRENIAAMTIGWPDGSRSDVPEAIIQFIPRSFQGLANIISDTVFVSPTSIDALVVPGVGMVPFLFNVNVPIEYARGVNVDLGMGLDAPASLQDNSQWISAIAGDNNQHFRIFTGAGACALEVVGQNQITSAFRGPWKNP